MFFGGHCEQWAMRTVEKWASCATRLYLSSITKTETKLTAYLGSPATEKLFPDWNPIHQEKQKRQETRRKAIIFHSRKINYMHAGVSTHEGNKVDEVWRVWSKCLQDLFYPLSDSVEQIPGSDD